MLMFPSQLQTSLDKESMKKILTTIKTTLMQQQGNMRLKVLIQSKAVTSWLHSRMGSIWGDLINKCFLVKLDGHKRLHYTVAHYTVFFSKTKHDNKARHQNTLYIGEIRHFITI